MRMTTPNALGRPEYVWCIDPNGGSSPPRSELLVTPGKQRKFAYPVEGPMNRTRSRLKRAIFSLSVRLGIFQRFEHLRNIAAMLGKGGGDQRAFIGRRTFGQRVIRRLRAIGAIENGRHGEACRGHAQRETLRDRLQLADIALASS